MMESWRKRAVLAVVGVLIVVAISGILRPTGFTNVDLPNGKTRHSSTFNPLQLAGFCGRIGGYDGWNGYLYVFSTCANLTVLNTVNNTVVSYLNSLFYGVSAVVVDPNNGNVYVSGTRNAPPTTSLTVGASQNSTPVIGIAVYSGANDSLLATIPLNWEPYSLAYDSNNGDLYATNGSDVAVISGTTNEVIATIPIGDSWGIAYDPQNQDIYVTNDSNLSVISGNNNTIIGTVLIGPGLFANDVVCDSGNGELFVATVSGAIYVVSDSRGGVVAAIPFAFSEDLTYDSVNDNMYALTRNNLSAPSDMLSIISGSRNGVIENLSLNMSPIGVVANSATGYVYVFPEGFEDYNMTILSGETNSVVGIVPLLSLYSVTVLPKNVALVSGENATITAVPQCHTFCPEGIDYIWTLSGNIGTLTQETSTTVNFVAGNTVGNGVLSLKATIDGITMRGGTVSISVSFAPFLGLPGIWGYVLVVVVVAVVAAVVILFVVRKRNEKELPPPSPPPPP